MPSNHTHPISNTWSEREQHLIRNELQASLQPAPGSTACFNCRALRQRCDRQIPCSRCASQSRQCSYPSGTNRGKRRCNNQSRGNLSVINDLLDRLDEEAVRDQVVKSLLNSSFPLLEQHAAAAASLTSQLDGPTIPARRRRHAEDHDGTENEIYPLVSPFDAMAAAVTTATKSGNMAQGSRPVSLHGKTGPAGLIGAKVENYFSPAAKNECDWQALLLQPPGGLLKLDHRTCDPVSAGVIEQSDSSSYFDLFFKIRNPILGILDPDLHTPSYVYAKSFTLFSVICALGCAVSSRVKDRMLYPILLDLAEADVKWSIAFSVKSLETIQAIMIKQYWAPTPRCHSEDPSWLRLSHAIQIAREMGIHKPQVISSHVLAATSDTQDSSLKERIARNFERTWLYIFLADKGFGITIGRHMSVSWREIPALTADWWRKPMAAPTDRILSGVVETRGILLNALAQRKHADDGTATSISEWHRHYFDLMEKTRSVRCVSEKSYVSKICSVMAFYIDHGIMVLNAEATRSLLALSNATTTPNINEISKISVKVASRFLKLTFNGDEGLGKLLFGFQNNQLIMICHAATEILQAMARGALRDPELSEAAALVKMIPDHLARAADHLPASCMAHLYLDIARCFASQATSILAALNSSRTDDTADEFEPVFPLADWWRELEVDSLDSAVRFDIGPYGSDRFSYELENFTGSGFFDK